ncbi:hypothetical protein [Streptomyces sp. CRB46]|uniref:hypothetical protein n=1 Tax=Streptomyces sp. CRB46 TaxID=2682613 RepID=UPI0018F32DF2|nr:hypothetical protein [Streptomyces sp. CRB46]
MILGSVPGPLSCRTCHHIWLSAETTAAECRPGIHVAQCPDCCETEVLIHLATVLSAPRQRQSMCFAGVSGRKALEERGSCEQCCSPRREESGLRTVPKLPGRSMAQC